MGVNLKIVLTAGHSNTDPGAVAGGATEAALATEIRNVTALLLRTQGHTVYTDGDGAVNKPLAEAIALIGRYRPDVALEVHMNAAANPAATGVETIALPKDKRLAQAITAGVAKALGLRVRGDNGWIDQSQSARGRLGYINAGGLILETAFISNPGDLAVTKARTYELAAAIADALTRGAA